MKRILPLLLFFFSLLTFAQTDENPIVFETAVKKVSETEYQLIFTAKIYQNWHLYSQYNPEDASLPIEITAADTANFTLVGKAIESETHTAYSKTWNKDEIFFSNHATLTQNIVLTSPETTSVTLNFFGQVCKEACIQLDEDFTFQLTGEKTVIAPVVLDENSKIQSKKLKLNLTNSQRLQTVSEQEDTESTGLFGIFFLGFMGGLLALLTPCVFPMIPLTVSFFTKQSQSKSKGIRNAILYGVFIVVIYILLSLPFHFLDSLDPEILNTISTNVWLNVFFFVILAFFSGSFFGYYELTLPSSWGNKMDNASSVGGIVGIFFMALTLAIVSFSCTGPILGSLLAGSLTSDGGAMQLTAGMSGFGFALALPFALFAMFPSWLNSLPKSGGWLNTTKVILGFLELAFAFKFLSNADLVAHWGFLKREIFIGIWILIFGGLALYLFGKIKFPHDGPLKKITLPRWTTGIALVAFVVYLFPGVTPNPAWELKLLSGFPPPQFYSIYPQESNCPLGLDCYKDFEKGLAHAKEVNKPILLDFTGWACVNCRKMEENVWSENKVYTLIKEDYVLISLYVDDRKELPAAAQFNYLKDNGKLKKIETVGDKWSTFQALNFKTLSQPYYVLLSPDLDVLHHAEQYTDTNTYYTWLQEGLQKFKE